MVAQTYRSYTDSFKGLSPEVWWISLVVFINRAGTMVVPFLSLYLTEDLHFSLDQVAWIMTAFGVGSMMGSWLGGKLTDRFGYYPVVLYNLLLTGVIFILFQYITSFAMWCICVVVLLTIADTVRPALFVALNNYSKPENRTRSVTLVRLAINLGFTFGPAAGGMIIAGMGYAGLFWVDGLTCILAAILFFFVLDQKKAAQDKKEQEKKGNVSPYRDKPYLLFALILVLIGFAFMQYFSTIPLFYREVHLLAESEIGWLLGMNGFLIFLIEMPLIKHYEQPRYSIFRIFLVSTLMFAASFLLLNMTEWTGILIVGMVLMTIGEMLNFPFLNRFAMDRAEKGNSGSYMALFTMAFSIAHIFGQNTGLQLVNHFGYEVTWYVMTGILMLAAFLFLVLQAMVKKEAEQATTEPMVSSETSPAELEG